MSNNSPITQIICKALVNKIPLATIRAPLAVLCLFWLTVAMAPQALAQACGPSLTVKANQWTMVGIPCVPPVAKRTVGDVFGPSMGTADYGVTWIVWKRVYDDNRCVVSSGPADCYIKLTLASAATTGDAFWIYTTEQKQMQFSSTTASTPGPYFEFPARLSTDGNSRYYMFANPYSKKVSWSNIVFPSTISGSTSNLSSQQAVNRSIVSKNVHYWNGNTYFTRDLSSPVAEFTAKESAWLEMLQPNPAVVSNVKVRVPQP